MNINRVDPGVVKELVNRRGKRKPQPLANVDFGPKDAVHSPLNHIRVDCELGAQKKKDNVDLRRAVRICARENFPRHRRGKVWLFIRAIVGEAFFVGHLVSSFEPLPGQCLEDK